MPITKNAKKTLRASFRKRGYNLARKKAMTEVLKSVNKLLAEKKVGEVSTLIPKVYQAIDKAVKRGVIKKNTAARKKSRLIKRIKKVIAALK